MASGTITPPRQPDPSNSPPPKYAAFIEDRLQYTRRQVKVVDLASGLMILTAGTLSYFLAVAVLDHWVIAGGLGFTTRLLLWIGAIAAGGTFFWRYLLPPLAHRINPIYAAQTIEHSRPTIKNSLINLLLFRGHRNEVSPVVYQAMEQRAATDLSQVHIESAVDRGRVLRLVYVLAGVVAIFAIYLALSPKNPLTSAARVLWPWARIAAPTRVNFNDVRPGDTVALYGDRLDISADVSGLRNGETVSLIASTADGQVLDEVVPMTKVGEGTRFQCSIPPGNVGLQQNMSYRLTAGDCTTPQYTVEVQIAPTIVVDSVEYRFPNYTGLPKRVIPGQGDIKALEGTQVTIHAAANQDIKDAQIDLNCAGKQMLPMKISGKIATGHITLALDRDNPTRPLYDSYQVLFTSASGRTNHRPIRYRIDVDRDIAPDVQILEPKDDEVSVPLDGKLVIRVRAEDTDYALRRVSLQAEKDGKPLALPPLLDTPAPAKPWQGPFEKTFEFEPAKLELKPGDNVKYWAEALDNKENPNHEPAPNRSETGPRIIHITKPGAPSGQTPPSDEKPQRALNDPKQSSTTPDPSNRSGNKPKPAGEPNQPQDSQTSDQDKKNAQSGDKMDSSPHSAKEQQPDNQAKGSDSGEQNQSGDKGANSQGGSSNDTAANQGETGQKQDGANESADNNKNQPVDGPHDPDTAFQKILDDKQKQDQVASNDQKQNQPGDSSKDQSAGQEQNSSGDKSQQQSQDQSGGQKQQQQQNQSNDNQQDQSGGKSGQQQGQSGQKQDAGSQQSGQQQNQGDPKSNPSQQGDQSGSQSQKKQGQKQQSDPKQSGKQDPSGSGSQDQQGSGGKSGEQQQQGGSSGSQGKQPQAGGQQSDSKQAGSEGSQGSQQGQSSQSPSPSQQSGSSASDNSAQGGQKSDSKQQSSSGSQGNPQGSSGQSPDKKQAAGSQDKQDSQSSAGAGQKPDSKQSGSASDSKGQQAQSGSRSQDKKPSGGGSQSQSAQSGGQPENKQSEKNQSSGSQSSDNQMASAAKPGKQPSPGQQSSSSSDGAGQSKQEQKPNSEGSSGGGKQSQKGSQQQSTGGGDMQQKGKGGSKGNGVEDNASRQQDPGNGKGNDSQSNEGSPSPEAQQGSEGPPKSSDSHANQGQNSDKDNSPAINTKDSQSQGDTSGDRKGGGGKGGGQASKQTGKGSSGSTSEAKEGGSATDAKGEGETGTKAGDAARSDHKTGSLKKDVASGQGDKQPNTSAQPSPDAKSGQTGETPEGNTAEKTASDSGQGGGKPSQQPGGTMGSGVPNGGSRGSQAVDDSPAPPPAEKSGADDPNLDFTRKQVDLALEHLKDQLAKDKPQLLQELGWSKDEARRFLDTWQARVASARQSGPQGVAANKAFNEALKSLDLRPHGTQLKGGRTSTDKLGGLRDPGQFDPPGEWDDLFRQYSRATGGKSLP